MGRGKGGQGEGERENQAERMYRPSQAVLPDFLPHAPCIFLCVQVVISGPHRPKSFKFFFFKSAFLRTRPLRKAESFFLSLTVQLHHSRERRRDAGVVRLYPRTQEFTDDGTMIRLDEVGKERIPLFKCVTKIMSIHFVNFLRLIGTDTLKLG